MARHLGGTQNGMGDKAEMARRALAMIGSLLVALACFFGATPAQAQIQAPGCYPPPCAAAQPATV
ncbi:MAG: hypothetical protein M3Y04_06480, partial [Actinomycetota bacterium]|nr:hypothetical protein [Actinomycetota bacterium]